MANVKINILDFCGNNHWHYELIINGKLFISGWYQYTLPYVHYGYWYELQHAPNGFTQQQINRLNRKYAFIQQTNANWAMCFTKEAIDLVKDKIHESYYSVIERNSNYNLTNN